MQDDGGSNLGTNDGARTCGGCSGTMRPMNRFAHNVAGVYTGRKVSYRCAGCGETSEMFDMPSVAARVGLVFICLVGVAVLPAIGALVDFRWVLRPVFGILLVYFLADLAIDGFKRMKHATV